MGTVMIGVAEYRCGHLMVDDYELNCTIYLLLLLAGVYGRS